MDFGMEELQQQPLEQPLEREQPLQEDDAAQDEMGENTEDEENLWPTVKPGGGEGHEGTAEDDDGKGPEHQDSAQEMETGEKGGDEGQEDEEKGKGDEDTATHEAKEEKVKGDKDDKAFGKGGTEPEAVCKPKPLMLPSSDNVVTMVGDACCNAGFWHFEGVWFMPTAPEVRSKLEYRSKSDDGDEFDGHFDLQAVGGVKRFAELDLRLVLTPNSADGYNIEGTGENTFGKFSIAGIVNIKNEFRMVKWMTGPPSKPLPAIPQAKGRGRRGGQWATKHTLRERKRAPSPQPSDPPSKKPREEPRKRKAPGKSAASEKPLTSQEKDVLQERKPRGGRGRGAARRAPSESTGASRPRKGQKTDEDHKESSRSNEGEIAQLRKQVAKMTQELHAMKEPKEGTSRPQRAKKDTGAKSAKEDAKEPRKRKAPVKSAASEKPLTSQEKDVLQDKINKLNDDQMDEVINFMSLDAKSENDDEVELDLDVLPPQRQHALVKFVDSKLARARA